MSKKAHSKKHRRKKPEMALFFSISGMRGTGRTSLFSALRIALPKEFPKLECAFLGDPFGNLSHPLTWAESERDMLAVSRLFLCWAHLNDFNLKKLRHSLKDCDVVITDGYGLNAVLYATACVECEKTDSDVLSMHKRIVKDRVKEQGIEPPEYFITCADVDRVTEYLRTDVCPDLTPRECRAFIEKEEEIIRAYFEPDYGQKEPHFLDASLPTEVMCSHALRIISERIARKKN